MKSIGLTLVFLLFLSLSIYGQSNVGTSQTEYNYVTKGIKTQEEGGLDMKKGYSLKSLDNLDLNYEGGLLGSDKKHEFFGLKREGDKYFCAIAVKITTNSANYKYLCIPGINTEKEIVVKCKQDWQFELGASRTFELLWRMFGVITRALNSTEITGQ